MTATQRALLNTLRLALAGVAIGLAAGPFFLADTQLGVLADFFSMLVLAIMWNLLAGYADIVTIGQHAFVGVGAYAFYAFAALAGVDPYLSIPLAGVVALIIAVPAMALLFRLRTAYLSIGTWVVAEVMMLGAGKIEAFGGGSGISVPIEILRAFGSTRSRRLATIYWLGFALAVFALGSTYLLLRSRFGVGLMAMRDNEESAASVGVNVTRARILCFLGVAPVLGITGAVITLQKLRIAPQASFSIVDWSVLITFIVVIRHRHNRGADSGRNLLLCFAGIPVRSRDLALNPTRCLFDRNHHDRPARNLGSHSSFCAARRPHFDSASIVFVKPGSGGASAP